MTRSAQLLWTVKDVLVEEMDEVRYKQCQADSAGAQVSCGRVTNEAKKLKYN